MKKVNALVLGLVVMLAFGCGEDKPEPEPIVSHPHQSKSGCYLAYDSSIYLPKKDRYFYDTVGRLIYIDRKKYNHGPDHEFLDYDGSGKLSQQRLYTEDSVLFQYKTYSYNGKGQLDKVSTFGSQTEPVSQAKEYETYTYDAQGRVLEYNWFLTPQSPVAENKFTFEYRPEGSVIERTYVRNNTSFALFMITEFQFDNKNSPFTSLYFPLGRLLFKNNITSMKHISFNGSPTQLFTISYQYNSQGYPVKVATFDGQQTFDEYYFYNCQ